METNFSDAKMPNKRDVSKKRNVVATILAFWVVGGVTWLFLAGALLPSNPALEQYNVETATNRQVSISEVNQVDDVTTIITTITETTPHGWFHDFGSAIAASLSGSKVSSSIASTSVPGPNEVVVRARMFTPGTLTVPAGTTITWSSKNDVESHTIVSDAGLFNMVLNIGGAVTFTFTEPGTYTYHCTPHPEMKGTIIVTATPKPAAPIPAVTAAPTSASNTTNPSPAPAGVPISPAPTGTPPPVSPPPSPVPVPPSQPAIHDGGYVSE